MVEARSYARENTGETIRADRFFVLRMAAARSYTRENIRNMSLSDLTCSQKCWIFSEKKMVLFYHWFSEQNNFWIFSSDLHWFSEQNFCLKYISRNNCQPLFIWWGQFGFKFHKKRGDSTLVETGAAVASAAGLKKLAKVGEANHAEVRLWAAMGTLWGWSGDPKGWVFCYRYRPYIPTPGTGPQTSARRSSPVMMSWQGVPAWVVPSSASQNLSSWKIYKRQHLANIFVLTKNLLPPKIYYHKKSTTAKNLQCSTKNLQTLDI